MTPPNCTILAGNVKLKQGTALFYCDSCVINNNTKTFEAWGNVHINDSDTANIYSSHLRYLIDKKLAYPRRRCKTHRRQRDTDHPRPGI